MAIQFACPYCETVSSVPDSFAGKQGKCPSCQKVIEVPDPAGAGGGVDVEEPAPVSSGGGGSAGKSKTCRYCGETIKAVAKKCKFCGEFFEKGLSAKRRSHGKCPPTNMHWAIISLSLTVLLCIPFTPLSIASLVFAGQVSSKHSAGDTAGAQVASGRARLWAVLSILIPIAVLVVLGIVSAIA